MSAIEVRPRFKLLSSLKPEELVNKLSEQVKKEDCPCKAKILPHFASIRMDETYQHFWSPQMNIHFEDHEEGSYIRGMYGPNSNVWTFFMFLYGAVGFMFLLGMFFGVPRYMLGLTSNLLWLMPAALILFIMIFIMAKIGQNLGNDQREILRDYLIDALGDLKDITQQ
jgi:hypothetical protein